MSRAKVSIVRMCISATVVLLFSVAAPAQETPKEAWPEAQLYVKLNPQFRLRAMASLTKGRESQEFTEGTFEFDIDVGLKLIVRRALAANPNTERGKYFTMRVGYVRVIALNDDDNPSQEHRGILEFTPRSPLRGGFLLSDRSRVEARWINGHYSNRYRNRLRLERDFAIGKFRFTPYTTGELFYDTRYRIWNRNEYAFGSEMPIRSHAIAEFYFLRQNTSRSNTPHINAFGFVFQLHF